MISLKQRCVTNHKKQRYKKQQLLKAWRLSYSTRKRKGIRKAISPIVSKFQMERNIGMKSSLLMIYHNINVNWLLRR